MNALNETSVYNHMGSLVESWSDRIDLVEEVQGEELSYGKKLVLAQCLQNTMEAINMCEATDAGQVDGFKRFALDIVTAVIPNLVANEIVSIQPIDHEVGVINYIRYLYGNTKGRAQAGQEFASGLLYQGSDPYYSSQEIVGEGVVATAGKGANGTITSSLSWKPIIPGTIKMQVRYKDATGNPAVGFVVDTAKDGTLKLVDPEGNDVASVLGTATIDYASGALNVALTGDNELVDAKSVQLNYHYNNKSIGDGQIGTNALKVPEVNIRIDTLPVVCQSRKLKALYAFDAAYKLQKEYGTDINALLNTQIASEIAHEIDGELMEDLLTGAGLVNNTWNTTRPEGISLREHYDSFRTVIIEGSNKIFGATKRAQANFMVCGLNVANVLESMTQFVSSGAKNVIGPHVSGTIGNITVIKNPYYPTHQYVLGYKGTNLFDAGFYYCPYQPVLTTQLIMLDDFVGRRGWATSYAKKMVQPLLYCRGEITDFPYNNSGVVVAP